MGFGFRLCCLIILSLCHERFAIEPLADSRMSSQILKRAGHNGIDPRGGEVMFTGNAPLMGNKRLNGRLFRISKRKEQDISIPDIERQFHR